MAYGSTARSRDWRQSETHTMGRSGKWLARSLWTLALVTLTVLLVLWVWWIWPPKRIPTRLVIVQPHSNSLFLPPVPLPSDDALGESWWKEMFPEEAGIDVEVYSDPHRDEKTFSYLQAHLNERDADDENLILYVAGSAIAKPMDGAATSIPAIVCDDHLKDGVEHLYPVEELLDKIVLVPAPFKLVVLDLAPISCDPRSGALANDFASQLVDLVGNEKYSNANLWVYAACGPAEKSYLSSQFGASVFGHFVVQGLLGEADQSEPGEDGRGVVDLRELGSYVHDRVGDWCVEHGLSRQNQTPLLIEGGHRVRDTHDKVPETRLISVASKPHSDEDDEGDANVDSSNSDASQADSPDSKPAPETERKDVKAPPPSDSGSNPDTSGSPKKAAPDNSDKQTPPDDVAESGSPGSETGETTPQTSGNSPSNDAESATEKTDESAGPSPAESPDEPEIAVKGLLKLLADAWRTRDAFAARSSPLEATEYAPVAWRRLNERLLGIEQRIRYGCLSEQSELEHELQALARGTEDDWDWIKSLRDNPQTKLAADDLAALAQLYPEVRDAIRIERQALDAAPYYVRWHGNNSFRYASRHESYDQVKALLLDLSDLRQEIAEFQELMAASEADRDWAAIDSCRKGIERASQNLQRHRGNLERSMQRECERILEDVESGRPTKDHLFSIDNLLCTPLLPWRQRISLLQAIDKINLDGIAPHSSRPPPTAREIWKRYGEQAALESRLAGLMDAGFLDFSDPGDFLTANDFAPQAEAWGKFHVVGASLREFYAKLPPGDVDDGHHLSELAVRLADARDADRYKKIGSEEFLKATLPSVEFVEAPKDSLAIIMPAEFELDRAEEWKLFEVQVVATGGWAGEASIRLRYRPDQIEVQGPKGAAVPQTVQLKDGQAESLLLEIRSTPGADLRGNAKLTLHVDQGSRKKPGEVLIHVAPENRIELIADRIKDRMQEGAEERQSRRGDVILCRVFPEGDPEKPRQTEFVFRLLNWSRRARNVSLQLWALPEDTSPDDRKFAVLEGPRDAYGATLPGFEPLTEKLKLKLTAEDAPQRFQIPEPSEETPSGDAKPETASERAPKKETQEPTKEEPKEATGPELFDVSRGVLCVIEDDDDEEKVWKTWVRFVPIPPRRYLRPEVAYRREATKGEVEIKATAVDRQDDFCPPISSKFPVTITWQIPNQEIEKQVVSGIIEAPGTSSPVLRALINPDPFRDVEVVLNVDGYPRAFVYPFNTGRDISKVPEDLKFNSGRIHIRSPLPEAAYRPDAAPFRLQFEVDAPNESFNAFDDVVDLVEVGIDFDGDHKLGASERQATYDDDRRIVVKCEGLTPEGTLSTRARISDFAVDLDPKGRRGSLSLCAQLRLGGKIFAPTCVDILVDETSPKFKIVLSPREPLPGEELKITAEPEDRGGIQRVEFARDKNWNDKFDDGELIEPILDKAPWSMPYPLDEKEFVAGTRYRILGRAYDRAGNESKVATAEFTVRPAMKGNGSGNDKPKTGTIVGHLTRPGKKSGSLWSSGKCLGEPVEVDWATGEFVLENVPIGATKSFEFSAMSYRPWHGKKDVTLDSERKEVFIPMTEQ